jgi:hypothetical protein
MTTLDQFRLTTVSPRLGMALARGDLTQAKKIDRALKKAPGSWQRIGLSSRGPKVPQQVRRREARAVVGMATTRAWPSKSRRIPSRSIYFATGTDFPAFEPCKDRKD